MVAVPSSRCCRLAAWLAGLLLLPREEELGTAAYGARETVGLTSLGAGARLHFGFASPGSTRLLVTAVRTLSDSGAHEAQRQPRTPQFPCRSFLLRTTETLVLVLPDNVARSPGEG